MWAVFTPRGLFPEIFVWDMSGVAIDVKLFHESGCRLVYRYRIYGDPLPHPALRGGVMKKLLAFVNRTMSIAQLTHLHLSIPSSGTTSRPVPPECFPVVLLSRRPAASHRVSFAEDIDVIGSSPLIYPVGEPESITKSALVDTGPLERGDITIAQLTYVLFPTDDPFDGSHLLSFHTYWLLRDLLRSSGGAIFRTRPGLPHSIGLLLFGRRRHHCLHRHFPGGIRRYFRAPIETLLDCH